MVRILTVPMREVPAWAILERRLFGDVDRAWPRFVERFCEPDGRLRFAREFETRDGVDDFYEPFFNWPTFYLLGGSEEILAAAKHHWRGVTAQLTEAGMLHGEFENGYDWFHQGESLIFFYALCAADPTDSAFRERARRFARLYIDSAHGNYDPELNIIRAPHTGSLGARRGLGPEWESYSAEQLNMRPYGLPIEGIPAIKEWADLEDPSQADLMGAEMQRRAVGDAAVNLAATSLVVNHWLYDGDTSARDWVKRYVDGWVARANENAGILPDNVGVDGRVGSLQDGRWWGGHYGWNWPHGLPSVGMAAVIGGINAAFLTGRDEYLDVPRVILDTVIDNSIVASVAETPMSLQANWLSRLGADSHVPAMLVPHRFGSDGWFDFGPMPLELPIWLWWFSRTDRDLSRVRSIMSKQPESATDVKPFRDKAEAGHELPWLSFLLGENPNYPVEALSMALGQVARRAALVEAENPDPETVHIHFWQRVQPVVTEVLSQLISGTPQILYNGGLPFAAVRYEDADAGRPGLPPDIAALVTSIGTDTISLELVNTSMCDRHRIRVSPGLHGERDIMTVSSFGEVTGDYPGSPVAYTSEPGEQEVHHAEVEASSLTVELQPAHRAELVLTLTDPVRSPRHQGGANHDHDDERKR